VIDRDDRQNLLVGENVEVLVGETCAARCEQERLVAVRGD
jgi:hypothetical protein